ncbi:apoptosis regulator Bcl-2a [Brachyhypopomus gauderio]|uniref:apoptosis regulator Bcl-2a n=1 Tax=Brachyhypopomus gauderio TaxID=698409 RepID=UPI00404219D7
MANISPYDSRDIVEKYIYHKLLKKGYVWEFHPAEVEDDAPNNGLREVIDPRAPSGDEEPMCPIPEPDPHVRLNRVLREAGDEIERMYQRDFTAMSNQLYFTPSTAQRKFSAVIEELFSDGTNWGRIVAFLEFGGTMCVESVNREMASQVDNIARWMTDYLNGPLKNWIQDNGGWDAFMEMYSPPQRSMFQPWPYLKTVFGLAALGAAGVTIGALFTQK